MNLSKHALATIGYLSLAKNWLVNSWQVQRKVNLFHFTFARFLARVLQWKFFALIKFDLSCRHAPANSKLGNNPAASLGVLLVLCRKKIIRHLHISHYAAYLPPKFWITFVFHFSWVLQLSKEKLKTMLMQNFAGQIRCIMGDVQVANAQSKSRLLAQWNGVKKML